MTAVIAWTYMELSMTYEIYINDEFDCELYSIVDVFEYIDYNMVGIYCEEV